MEFLDSISDGVQAIYDSMTSPASFIEQIFLYLYSLLIKVMTYFQYLTFKASYLVAEEMVAGFAADERLNSLYNQLPSDSRSLLTVFRVPEGLNMIVSAIMTNFVVSSTR